MACTALNKLVIIGVGLIGGSFALAVRKAGLVNHIVGIGRSQENMH
ncbi:MAG: prephenate dehydrogenase/arogenate dehydrogenase family protein, partial [Pseudomonadota bacterium]